MNYARRASCKWRGGGNVATTFGKAPLGTHSNEHIIDHVVVLEEEVTRLREVVEKREEALRELKEVGVRVERCFDEVTALAGKFNGARLALSGLSNREQEVYRYIKDHPAMIYREVGKNLGISTRTVKSHLESIYAKLGIGGRNEL